MPSCSDTKPNYSEFTNTYLPYVSPAAHALGLPAALVLCHWYKEWGLPAYNPAWQTYVPSGMQTCGSCGQFPMFCSLDDGTQAYIAQMNYYNNGSHTDVFGQAVKLSVYFNDGFTGELHASNVQTDDGRYVNVTSQHFVGGGLSGTYAANEGLGASPWDAGHYMNSTDTYTGRQLNVILNDAGWQGYCYVP